MGIEGGTQPTDNASEDQYSGSGRKRADQRACDEQHDPQNENPSTAEKIAKCPPGQQQACINKIVGIDHPLHLADARMQIGGYAFHGKVDDRSIDLGEQHAKRSGNQNQTGMCAFGSAFKPR
jgi:hypothetical protein